MTTADRIKSALISVSEAKTALLKSGTELMPEFAKKEALDAIIRAELILRSKSIRQRNRE